MSDGLCGCEKQYCAWWCGKEGCAVKLIALQLIKLEEKK